MKILHVISQLTKGGAERVAVELANSFSRSGDEVAMLVTHPTDPALLQERIDSSVDLRFVTSRPRSRVLTYAASIRWLIRNREFVLSRDVVHVHLTFGSAFGIFVSVLRKVRGARVPKVIETYHAVGMPMNAVRWRMTALLCASHDGFVAMASDPRIAKFVEDHPRLASACIPNGIALPFPRATRDEAQSFRASAGIPEGLNVVGTVGRLVPGRRPDKFVQIFGHVAASCPEVHFLMAGDGPEREDILKMAREARLRDRLHLSGLAPRPELPLSVIDVYLTLNVGDVTGIAAMEAIASAVPAVAYQGDATYAGDNDWIYSSAVPADVAAEIVRLLRCADERRVLAQAQYRVVAEKHSAQAMARAYRNFYRRLLAA